MKFNERSWAGHIIGWIQDLIANKQTIFEDATNDAGIKLEAGITKFPDILLFTDKTSGIIFNGWELKFPDTPVDDESMLENALEKAERIKANSFVTWNGAEAIIWKVLDDQYSLNSIERIKYYPKEHSINCREDLADPQKYRSNETKLRLRLNEILHDLEHLLQSSELKQAINISGNIINAIKLSANIIIPQFKCYGSREI